MAPTARLEKFPPPFFIVGSTRSGATLASRILDSHSRIAVYHESHYYPIFRPDLHRYGDLRRLPNLKRFIEDVREVTRVQGLMDPPTTDELLEILVEPSFEGVLTTLLQLHARKQGKVHCSDKTPGHHAYLAEILEKFPRSPIIFVMRDPRDTVLAIRKKFATSLKGAIQLWNDAFRSYQKVLGKVYLVRYEELAQRPVETVQALCAHLEENYEPQMLRVFERIPSRLARNPHNRDLLRPVDPTLVGRFRQMPQQDIEWIESACATGMEVLGYSFTQPKAKLVETAPPTKLDFFMNRVRYYRSNWKRWRPGWMRWKIVLRVRARYFLTLLWIRESR